MKTLPALVAGLSLGYCLVGDTVQQELSPGLIQPMLVGLNLKPRSIGTDVWEITGTADNLDVPVAIGLSSSGRKLWMTVYLGELDAKLRADPERLLGLLKMNYAIQPAHFFVTSEESDPPGHPQDILKVGMAVDNRGITNSVLQREIEKIVSDVASTRKLWEKG